MQKQFGAAAPQITGAPRIFVQYQDIGHHIIVQYPIAVPAGTADPSCSGQARVGESRPRKSLIYAH
jgi:hypothetical protein